MHVARWNSKIKAKNSQIQTTERSLSSKASLEMNFQIPQTQWQSILTDIEIRTLFPRFVFHEAIPSTNASVAEGLSRRFMKRGTRRLHFPRETVFSFHFQTYFHPGWKEPGLYSSKTARTKLGRVHGDCGLTAIIRSATRKSISTASSYQSRITPEAHLGHSLRVTVRLRALSFQAEADAVALDKRGKPVERLGTVVWKNDGHIGQAVQRWISFC